jgi:hypothetical protein
LRTEAIDETLLDELQSKVWCVVWFS